MSAKHIDGVNAAKSVKAQDLELTCASAENFESAAKESATDDFNEDNNDPETSAASATIDDYDANLRFQQ